MESKTNTILISFVGNRSEENVIVFTRPLARRIKKNQEWVAPYPGALSAVRVHDDLTSGKNFEFLPDNTELMLDMNEDVGREKPYKHNFFKTAVVGRAWHGRCHTLHEMLRIGKFETQENKISFSWMPEPFLSSNDDSSYVEVCPFFVDVKNGGCDDYLSSQWAVGRTRIHKPFEEEWRQLTHNLPRIKRQFDAALLKGDMAFIQRFLQASHDFIIYSSRNAYDSEEVESGFIIRYENATDVVRAFDAFDSLINCLRYFLITRTLVTSGWKKNEMKVIIKCISNLFIQERFFSFFSKIFPVVTTILTKYYESPNCHVNNGAGLYSLDGPFFTGNERFARIFSNCIDNPSGDIGEVLLCLDNNIGHQPSNNQTAVSFFHRLLKMKPTETLLNRHLSQRPNFERVRSIYIWRVLIMELWRLIIPTYINRQPIPDSVSSTGKRALRELLEIRINNRSGEVGWKEMLLDTRCHFGGVINRYHNDLDVRNDWIDMIAIIHYSSVSGWSSVKLPEDKYRDMKALTATLLLQLHEERGIRGSNTQNACFRKRQILSEEMVEGAVKKIKSKDETSGMKHTFHADGDMLKVLTLINDLYGGVLVEGCTPNPVRQPCQFSSNEAFAFVEADFDVFLSNLVEYEVLTINEVSISVMRLLDKVDDKNKIGDKASTNHWKSILPGNVYRNLESITAYERILSGSRNKEENAIYVVDTECLYHEISADSETAVIIITLEEMARVVSQKLRVPYGDGEPHYKFYFHSNKDESQSRCLLSVKTLGMQWRNVSCDDCTEYLEIIRNSPEIMQFCIIMDVLTSFLCIDCNEYGYNEPLWVNKATGHVMFVTNRARCRRRDDTDKVEFFSLDIVLNNALNIAVKDDDDQKAKWSRVVGSTLMGVKHEICEIAVRHGFCSCVNSVDLEGFFDDIVVLTMEALNEIKRKTGEQTIEKDEYYQVIYT